MSPSQAIVTGLVETGIAIITFPEYDNQIVPSARPTFSGLAPEGAAVTLTLYSIVIAPKSGGYATGPEIVKVVYATKYNTWSWIPDVDLDESQYNLDVEYRVGDNNIKGTRLFTIQVSSPVPSPSLENIIFIVNTGKLAKRISKNTYIQLRPNLSSQRKTYTQPNRLHP